jgi:hypothetical protein
VHRAAPFGDILDAISTGIGAVGVRGVVFTALSALAVIAVGAGVAYAADRVLRRSKPELTALLNESATFYARWPEDRLSEAPVYERRLEALRCQRIIELLQHDGVTGAGDVPDRQGAISGLRAWLSALRASIDASAVAAPNR